MNFFDKYDNAQSGFFERTRMLIAEFTPYIILLINVIFMVISNLFTVGFRSPLSDGFIIALMLNCTTSTLSYGSFVIYKETAAKKSNLGGYLDNCSLWAKISARIRSNDDFSDFIRYCEEQEDNEREEIRRSYISNHTRLSLSEFEKTYRSKSRKDLISLVKDGKLTRREVHYILKAQRHIRVKPIKPLLILSGTKVSSFNDAGRDDVSTVRSIAARPLTMIIGSLTVASINCVYSGIADGSALYAMFCSAFLIFFSALLGYTKGSSNIKRKNELVTVRIMYLERYEKQKKTAKTAPSDEV